VGWVVSEILSSEGLLRGQGLANKAMRIKKEERPVFLQISGTNPSRMAKAAQQCLEKGADGIDLNMGCPARKITKSGCGASLLKNPSLAQAVAQAVIQAVPCPVTVKIRSGWDADHLNFQEIGFALQEAGASAIAFHPRTRTQAYRGRANWDLIAELVESLSIPVVGNGDVKTPQDAMNLFAHTHCAAVMIGRGAVADPTIFSRTASLLRGELLIQKNPVEVLKALALHFRQVAKVEPPLSALHHCRSLLGQMVRETPGARSLRGRLNDFKSSEEAISGLEAYIASLDESIPSDPNGDQ